MTEQADQPELLTVPEADKWTAPEGGLAPAHTAARFKAGDPKKYQAVVDALRGGAAITTLAKVYKVSVNTLYAIIDSDLGGRAAYHAGLKDKMLTVMSLGVERITEMLPDCKDIAKVAVVTGIIGDKYAAFAGLPTATVEVRHTVDQSAIDEFTARLNAVRQARGRVVEEPPALEVPAA